MTTATKYWPATEADVGREDVEFSDFSDFSDAYVGTLKFIDGNRPADENGTPWGFARIPVQAEAPEWQWPEWLGGWGITKDEDGDMYWHGGPAEIKNGKWDGRYIRMPVGTIGILCKGFVYPKFADWTKPVLRSECSSDPERAAVVPPHAACSPEDYAYAHRIAKSFEHPFTPHQRGMIEAAIIAARQSLALPPHTRALCFCGEPSCEDCGKQPPCDNGPCRFTKGHAGVCEPNNAAGTGEACESGNGDSRSTVAGMNLPPVSQDAPPHSETEFTRLWVDHAKWSQEAFGSDSERDHVGPLKHLEKEAREAYEATSEAERLEEMADCLLLLMDANRRGGFAWCQLVDAARSKLEKNKLRQWPKNVPAGQPIEHVKEINLRESGPDSPAPAAVEKRRRPVRWCTATEAATGEQHDFVQIENWFRRVEWNRVHASREDELTNIVWHDPEFVAREGEGNP